MATIISFVGGAAVGAYFGPKSTQYLRGQSTK